MVYHGSYIAMGQDKASVYEQNSHFLLAKLIWVTDG